jgi:hypothetical protein
MDIVKFHWCVVLVLKKPIGVVAGVWRERERERLAQSTGPTT